MPLWAIESSNITLGRYAPLWGVVDDKYENSSALQTRRKDSLWLPAGMAFQNDEFISILDSTPAGAHLQALSAVHDIGNSLASGQTLWDYSAEKDYGLALRWRELSSEAGTAGTILNLIWTDITG